MRETFRSLWDEIIICRVYGNNKMRSKEMAINYL